MKICVDERNSWQKNTQLKICATIKCAKNDGNLCDEKMWTKKRPKKICPVTESGGHDSVQMFGSETVFRLGDNTCEATIVVCRLGSACIPNVLPWFYGSLFVSPLPFISYMAGTVSGFDSGLLKVAW